ncbi:MAG: sigma-54 dependent transcriptional regulator [Robiginitomaculum sp.]|nr:sigma-54 dependent transcriptional regulator [Robiginitomaculum sp.]MDQ7078215.1 sigma-54 dependent transcriptional regulator [Robiginitomaculum sp.]
MSADILVVDDEEDIRELIGGILEDDGYEARTADGASSALMAISDRKPALVILDVWLQGSERDGIGVLEEVKALDPDLPVILISGHGTIETAVSAIRKGAYDFIEKPFNSERLLLVVRRALETVQLRRENLDLKANAANVSELIGVSQSINAVRQVISRVARANSRVLVIGPMGAGKQLVARNIHEQSERRNGRFVAINAAAMTPDSVELELFGSEDASGKVTKAGLFEQAHMGTLYIDEVGDMPLETQGKLLHLLVAQSFRRLGGSADVKVDVRVISSTSKNLTSLIERGLFREALYHRLNVVPVHVPALSERREDIPALVNYFVSRLSAAAGQPPRLISDDVMAYLQAARWPGNVRQLRNNIERILILANGDPSEPLTLDQLPMEQNSDDADSILGAEKLVAFPLREARLEFEREYLKVQVSRFGGNISRTATFIGMERSALHRKLKSLGIQPRNAKNTGDRS